MAALYLLTSAGAGVAAVLAWNWLAPVAPRLGSAVCDPIREDWEEVGKTPGGRVNRESFKVRSPLPLPAACSPRGLVFWQKHCLAKHASKLTPASTKVYTQFLDRLFDTGTGLMLTPGVAEKSDLGRHCFSYCNLLAGEFYFQQAADSQPDGSSACGCGTPVADLLQLVPPKK